MSAQAAFEIREYTKRTDFDAVVRLHQELNRVEVALGAIRDPRFEAAVACMHEDTRVIQTSGGEQLVATVAGDVVGYVALERAKFGAFVPPEQQWHVHIKNLVIAPAFRRYGIGKAFLARADELARLNGYALVTLSYVAGNAAAEAAYVKAGFATAAIEMVKRLD